MYRINLHRMTPCDQCEQMTPVPDNAKRYDDERDRAVLCDVCARRIQVAVQHDRLMRGHLMSRLIDSPTTL